MNQARYEQLVGMVLDEEASPEQMAELSRGLRHRPDRLADFHGHLVLWELWSQECQPERSADSFVAGWRTRLSAESLAEPFVQRTLESLEPKRARGWAVLEGLRELVTLARTRLPPGWCAVAASILLLAGFWLWCFGAAVGQPVLSETHSGLVLERAGNSVPVLKNTRLLPGDLLRVPANATAAITFPPERTRIELEQGTDFRFGSTKRGKHFTLLDGKIEVAAARQRPFHPLVIETPVAVARVVGTRFSLQTTTTSSRLEVTEGRVRFSNRQQPSSVTVSAGHYAVVESNVELQPLPLTGSILREVWTNVPSDAWTELLALKSFPTRPDESSYLTNLTVLEMPPNQGTNYGQLLRGYFHPPETGLYTFWVDSEGWGSLYLSRDDTRRHKVHMAHSNILNDRAAQQSSPVLLTAGRRYYFEVVHKAGEGENHLSVAMKGPGHPRGLLPMRYVSPFKND